MNGFPSRTNGIYERQRHLRGKHSRLALSVDIAMIPGDNAVDPQETETMHSLFGGKILGAAAPHRSFHGIDHRNIQLFFNDINVNSNKSVLLFGHPHTFRRFLLRGTFL